MAEPDELEQDSEQPPSQQPGLVPITVGNDREDED